jgi:hypothetical protein
VRHSPTEKQASSAAKQLHYHRERLHWMREKIRQNEALLLLYLSDRDADTAILPGGYRIRGSVSLARCVEVEERVPRNPYEQLELHIEEHEVA